jgi:transcriptional regulator with XRE-family HTH domain
MLHVISLAQYAAIYTRSWAVDSLNGRLRLRAELDRANEEISRLREEMRVKDVRMARIDPHRRPYYPPTERMTILELRAARGWSIQQTADRFLVTAATISSWMKRIDEEGPQALMQLHEPFNKFPDYVRYAVQRLKVLYPSMGKVKIAQMLCRAGLHLGATTVGRILKEPPPPQAKQAAVSSGSTVTAKRPNHVWHIDLTVVPTGSGFWVSWLPHALLQNWPFCWWVVVIVDHFSRRTMNIGAFKNKPDCRGICVFLGQTIRRCSTAPKYIICDRDSIFDCNAFRRYVKWKQIKPPRYGAVGKHGSIAVVERCILTLKDECTRKILVPYRRDTCRRHLVSFVDWYNEHRPHTTLAGKTPNEVYFGQRPAHRGPRIEPRRRWPRGSRCAMPQTLIAGQPGDRFTIELDYHRGRKHLPIVSLKRAA